MKKRFKDYLNGTQTHTNKEVNCCENCGTPISDDKKFCSKCEKELSQEKEKAEVYQIKVLLTPIRYSVVTQSKDKAIKMVMNDYYNPAQEIYEMWVGKERVDLSKY